MPSPILTLGTCHPAKGMVAQTRNRWGADWVWLAAGFSKDGRKRRGSSHLSRASPSRGDAGDDAGTEPRRGKSSPPPPPLTLLTQTQTLSIPVLCLLPLLVAP